MRILNIVIAGALLFQGSFIEARNLRRLGRLAPTALRSIRGRPMSTVSRKARIKKKKYDVCELKVGDFKPAYIGEHLLLVSTKTGKPIFKIMNVEDCFDQANQEVQIIDPEYANLKTRDQADDSFSWKTLSEMTTAVFCEEDYTIHATFQTNVDGWIATVRIDPNSDEWTVQGFYKEKKLNFIVQPEKKWEWISDLEASTITVYVEGEENPRSFIYSEDLEYLIGSRHCLQVAHIDEVLKGDFYSEGKIIYSKGQVRKSAPYYSIRNGTRQESKAIGKLKKSVAPDVFDREYFQFTVENQGVASSDRSSAIVRLKMSDCFVLLKERKAKKKAPAKQKPSFLKTFWSGS